MCEPHVRSHAVAAMGRLASYSAALAADTLPHVVDALEDEDVAVRQNALGAMG